ncbi:MAG: OmpA family protein [Lewinellaceae bacterium]|nr:OmpA family protein [Lewinellaceae bacterium]
MALKNISGIIAFLLLSGNALVAQSGTLKRADDAMRDLDYITAISLYQQVLQKEDNAEAKVNVAECYRKINDTENAEYWYAQVVQLPNARSIHRLYYGMMLQANGKCDLAKAWLKQYIKEAPNDARGQYLAQACDLEEELMTKNRGFYVVSHMPFNSNLDDFSPTVFANTVIFASDRDQSGPVKRTSMWTGNPFAELYSVPFEIRGIHPGDFQYGGTAKFSKELNTKYHEAAVCVSPDGQMIYFTRNNFDDGKTGRSDEGLVKLKIYGAQTTSNGSWTNITGLPFNSDEYSVAHPSLSADGQRLYFSSNMPGGYGDMDLYVSELVNERWGPGVNLGPVVNTEGNEIFPYIDPNNRLYFSSNGHIGLGGLDIYYTTGNGLYQWNLPVNLGFPMNSKSDDFGITFGGDLTWGYFSSDRDGGAGRDDVYGFQKSASPVEIFVYDAQSKIPVSGAAVANSQTDLTLTTGPDGKIAFDMRYADCADFSVGKKGYEPVVKRGCTNETTPGEITRIEIPIQKQANFIIQGIVFDMTDGYPAEGARVTLANECGKAVPQAYITGSDGRYKFKLDKDCCYSVKAVKDGFIAATSSGNCTKSQDKSTTLKANLSLLPYSDGEGILADSLEKSVLQQGPKFNPATGLYENPDGSPASFDLNKGLTVRNGVLFDNGTPSKPEKGPWERGSAGYLLHLYYDYNQVNMRQESRPELEKLAKTLLENPDLQVEISSHTDSRGSDEYNLELSQKRADAVVIWLTQHGVARERLTGRGYGETQPVNHCTNDAPCSEAEYQLNRRTEFRVIGSGVTISQPKIKGKSAPCAGCPF